MNTMPIAGLILGVVLAAMPGQVGAQGGPPPWAGQGRGAAAVHDEFAALERFLSMDDAELEAMQQAIARVRAMTPEQRSALHAQLAAYRQLPEDRRAEVRAGWGWHDAKDRDDWRAMMRSKSSEDRSAVQRELLALPVEQRMTRKHEMLEAWRRALGDRPAAE